ncbi:acylphosphatase [Acinetobacter gerneri]|uniref:acylphosphatase n=1 Tax=Acinetobacter gerneri TaxID=202952 RepID=UPI003A88E70B
MKTIKLIIHGRVQGVGYRRWFEQNAQNFALVGYVKNLENGDVEAVIQGPEADLQAMIKLSYIVPLRANVEGIAQEVLSDAESFTHFKMLR